MNKNILFINICLLLGILISCEVEKKNNTDEEKEITAEKLDNSIPFYRYLEKRNADDLPIESWRYDSTGKLEEYCAYDSNNPKEIKVTVYNNDTEQKEKIGSQILKYANNSITGKTELLEKKTYDTAGKELYKAVKTINNNEIKYIEKEDGEIINCCKSEYENTHLIKEYFYDDEFQDLTEELSYQYDATSGRISDITTINYHDVDDDDTDDVTKEYFTQYYYGISGDKSYKKETFLLKEDDTKDSCEIAEYELDNDGYVVKEHSVSDGKDQNYTVYTYGKYKDKKYKQNVAFYNNVETDNQLVGKEEYRYYDDNDSGDYFYEEMQYCYSDKYGYKEDDKYNYVSRSKKGIIKGRNENVNR